MAETRFKALLSCSFAPEDQHIVDFFKEYIESFGFEVIKYDFQEPIPLPDGVKNQIRNADCLVAIATRRHRIQESEVEQGSRDSWICPEWIDHEIVYAYAVGKPVAIFAETGVRVRGLIEREERYQRFSREEPELLRGVHLYNRFLLALRDTLETQMKTGRERAPLLFYHSVHSRDELLEDGTFVTTCEVELESLVKGFAYCTEGIGDLDWLRAPQEAVEKFQFSVLAAPQKTTVNPLFQFDKEHPTEWRVVFTPPLDVGGRVKYAFRYHARSVRPLTREEAEQAIKSGSYWSTTPRSVVNWDFERRVGELVCEVFFPPNYPVHEPEVRVELDEAGLLALAEMERLKEANAFTVQKFFDRFTLSLRVSKPILGRYMVTWQPPRRDEVTGALSGGIPPTPG